MQHLKHFKVNFVHVIPGSLWVCALQNDNAENNSQDCLINSRQCHNSLQIIVTWCTAIRLVHLFVSHVILFSLILYLIFCLIRNWIKGYDHNFASETCDSSFLWVDLHTHHQEWHQHSTLSCICDSPKITTLSLSGDGPGLWTSKRRSTALLLIMQIKWLCQGGGGGGPVATQPLEFLDPCTKIPGATRDVKIAMTFKRFWRSGTYETS